MGDYTGIEWTDATWTPIRARFESHTSTRVGWHCEHVSEGCRNCYSGGINRRLGTGQDFKPGLRKYVDLFLDDKMLLQPLRWKKPRMIFVCSMTDLFADFVPDEWIDQVFAVMALAPQHTFQVLTKRSARMQSYLAGKDRDEAIGFTCHTLGESLPDLRAPWHRGSWLISPRDLGVGAAAGLQPHQNIWPLPNVWLGVSAEDQKRAEERIPDLIETPAAIRFVSAEPLLGPLDLTEIDINGDGEMNALAMRSWAEIWADAFDPAVTGTTLEEAIESFEDWGGTYPPTDIRPRGLDWVIAGGESGPGARPMHPDWARSLRNQCAEAGVAFHFKQWGSNIPDEARAGRYRRVPKKEAGRLLDGVEHNGFPEVPA